MKFKRDSKSLLIFLKEKGAQINILKIIDIQIRENAVNCVCMFMCMHVMCMCLCVCLCLWGESVFLCVYNFLFVCFSLCNSMCLHLCFCVYVYLYVPIGAVCVCICVHSIQDKMQGLYNVLQHTAVFLFHCGGPFLSWFAILPLFLYPPKFY